MVILEHLRSFILFDLLILASSHSFGMPSPALVNSALSLSSSSSTTSSTETGDYNHEHDLSASANAAKLSVIEVYEHEYFDTERNAWIGGGPDPSQIQRWTSSSIYDGPTTRFLPPPPQINAPEGYQFTSDWKIDVTGAQRDELGWEYYVISQDSTSRGRRRRHWLRSVTINPAIAHPSTTMVPPPLSKPQYPISPSHKDRVRRPSPLQLKYHTNMLVKALRPITDSFNFKGYGFTFYKSLLTKHGAGVSFRLPLSAHLDYFDRRPFLPLVSSSFSLFYPWKGAFYLNASLPIELIKCFIMGIVDWIVWTVDVVHCFFYKTIFIDVLGDLIIGTVKEMVLSVLRMILLGQSPFKSKEDMQSKGTRSSAIKLYLGRRLPSRPSRRIVVYHQEISDRLGFSLGWSYSELRGFEFRCTWWHMVLPTIEYMSSAIGTALQPPPTRQIIEVSDEEETTIIDNNASKLTNKPTSELHDLDSALVKTTILRNEALLKWLRQRTGSMGISWGGFTPYPPYYSCSAAFSLSGYYFGRGFRNICTAPVNFLFSTPKQESNLNNDRLTSPQIQNNNIHNETAAPMVTLSPYDDEKKAMTQVR